MVCKQGSSCPQAPQVIVTSSGRTVKRRFQLLDDDPAQEVQPTIYTWCFNPLLSTFNHL